MIVKSRVCVCGKVMVPQCDIFTVTPTDEGCKIVWTCSCGESVCECWWLMGNAPYTAANIQREISVGNLSRSCACAGEV